MSPVFELGECPGASKGSGERVKQREDVVVEV